jgi:hypothetical protein
MLLIQRFQLLLHCIEGTRSKCRRLGGGGGGKCYSDSWIAAGIQHVWFGVAAIAAGPPAPWSSAGSISCSAGRSYKRDNRLALLTKLAYALRNKEQ